MKFAAIEGLFHGQRGAGLIAIGVLSPDSKNLDDETLKDYHFYLVSLCLKILENIEIGFSGKGSFN